MTPDNDEDNFTEADLQLQRDTPPLSRPPEKDPEPQAQAEQEPAPQQQAPEPDPELPAELKGKFVPHGRFHEANEQRKEAIRRADLVEQRTNALLQTMQQMVANQRPQQQPEPDKAPEDPIERIEWLTKRVDGYEQQERQRQDYGRQQQEWDNYAASVSNAASRDFRRALTDDPSLGDMYKFVTASRIGELMATGAMSQQQAEQQLRIEEVQGYGQAYQSGRTPDQVIRALAQARGYRPQQPAQQAQQPAQITQERRDQHRSLSQLGGREGPSALTAKDLGKMTEDEFAALPEKLIKSLMSR